MRVLVIGAGGVGSAFVSIAATREVYEHITVADIDPERSEATVAAVSDRATNGRIVATRVDASRREDVTELARSMRADVILNACDPRFNPPIFFGAFDGRRDSLVPGA